MDNNKKANQQEANQPTIQKGFVKFNKQIEGQYDRNFLAKSQEFYDCILEHMRSALYGRKTIGLDIGAGPGIGARLAATIPLETQITGYEPSKTHYEGARFAEKLAKKNHCTHYQTIQGGIEAIPMSSHNSLDYILILRAGHEIAESLGSPDKFIAKCTELLPLLKNNGHLIIADPQFSRHITENPDRFSSLIEEVKRFQTASIGHSHDPHDYICFWDLEQRLYSTGLHLERQDIIPKDDVLQYVLSKGFRMKESPTLFYVQTYKKKEKK